VKIWILNNTKIEKNKEWEVFFKLEFIPKLKKYAKPNDIIVHLGQIFNNSENISVKLLNKFKNILSIMNDIIPIYFLDGYDTELIKLINYNIIDTPTIINECKFIPKKYNIIEHIDKEIVFINSQVDTNILNKFTQVFYCGFYDNRVEEKNIIQVGSPYQFDNTSGSGFYIIDVKSKKHKYFENNNNIKFQTIKITNIEQISNLDKEFIENNHISVEIDKTLIDDKDLKIDILLNDFAFKKISYINNDNTIDLIDNTSLKMEDLLLEKIKNSDNKNLLSEFNNIIKIYKDRY
jgi:hypothetical protein